MSYIRRYITVLISSPRPPGRALVWILTKRVRGWWIGAAVGLALASPAHAEQVLHRVDVDVELTIVESAQIGRR